MPQIHNEAARYGHKFELFEPSSEDTQILNQYASTKPYNFEKPFDGNDRQSFIKNNFIILGFGNDYTKSSQKEDFNQNFSLSMMKQSLKPFMANDPYGRYGNNEMLRNINDAFKQTASNSNFDIKKSDAILKDFDIDIDEFDSKIIENPYEYIDPNYFLVSGFGWV